jgi:hypothetical protein
MRWARLQRPKDEVLDALFDWFLNAGIAAVPLGGHWLVRTFSDGKADLHHVVPAWTADVLVLCITLAGVSGVNAFTRIVRCEAAVKMGRAPTLFVFAALLVLLFAAILYGLVMSGHALPTARNGALCGLMTAILVSIYLDLTIAGRIAATRANDMARATG